MIDGFGDDTVLVGGRVSHRHHPDAARGVDPHHVPEAATATKVLPELAGGAIGAPAIPAETDVEPAS